MIPEPPEIYKQVKIICNQQWDPEKRAITLDKLWKQSLSDKVKWRDYRDFLHEVRVKNYEALAYFDPEAKREIAGIGFYPVEKIIPKGKEEAEWVQLWDFDYWEKNGEMHDRKVYLPITMN